ncbi:MAG: hypothetical protein HXY49_00195 [Ignavibacteriaceae bacterium]|nr:hypothetical protein [Ignavibacteriaceae bacterium]
MKNIIVPSVFLFLLIISFSGFPQTEENESSENEIVLPDGIGIANQLEYSYDIEKKLEILENWLNVDYNKGIFSAGIRFDLFQPNDPNPAINRGKVRYADIAFKYIQAEIGDVDEGMDITVGNFYSVFGRGLILKIYEDRSIRIDNNLLGVKVVGRYSNLILTALTGLPESINSVRRDILHAVDLEYKGLENIRFGGSFASNQPDVEGIARTRMASLRIQPSIWNFDLYAEYGIKQNDDIKQSIFNGSRPIAGRAFYGSLIFYYENFSLIGEYKLYDNFTFQSNDGTVIYNTPPSVRKEYPYILLNRHPSPLNQANEKGFQIEADYSIGDHTFITATFSQTKTLPSNSFYQRVSGTNLPLRTQLKEGYFQVNHTWNNFISTTAAMGYREELDSDTKSLTPILENKIYLDDYNTLKLTIEHQQTTDRTTAEQYYNDVLQAEYLSAPKLSVSIVTEVQTKEPDEGRIVRKVWSFLQFGYKLGDHTDLSVLFGSRQAGNICVGGVCRFEPEFRGVEFKMLTRF